MHCFRICRTTDLAAAAAPGRVGCRPRITTRWLGFSGGLARGPRLATTCPQGMRISPSLQQAAPRGGEPHIRAGMTAQGWFDADGNPLHSTNRRLSQKTLRPQRPKRRRPRRLRRRRPQRSSPRSRRRPSRRHRGTLPALRGGGGAAARETVGPSGITLFAACGLIAWRASAWPRTWAWEGARAWPWAWPWPWT